MVLHPYCIILYQYAVFNNIDVYKWHMEPKNKCTNCGAKDWLQSETIRYIPAVSGDGTTSSDGLHVDMWMCKNCWLLMQFGSNK